MSKPLISELFPMTLYFVDNEDEYKRVMKKSGGYEFAGKDEKYNEFPVDGSAITIATDGENGLEIVVAIGEQETDERAISIIIHESVHVWQFTKNAIREKHPGIETEAYATQYYATWMIAQYKQREAARKAKAEKNKQLEDVLDVLKEMKPNK